MDDNEIREMIKRHEGYVGHIYRDTAGVLTCGWGHALHENSKVPVAASNAFFEQDWEEAIRGYKSLDLVLDRVRRAVLIDMIFNLGLTGFKKFEKMWAAIQKGDWEEAGRQMESSRWFKQVGKRGEELKKMMETGEI